MQSKPHIFPLLPQAMLTIKCETNTGAWHSRYTGVNYKMYRLPRSPFPSKKIQTSQSTPFTESTKNICMRDLRDLLSEKLRCATIQCIRRIMALECGVHEHCKTVYSESIAGIESLRRNLNCRNLSIQKEPQHTPEIPQRDVVATGDKWGFFTGISTREPVVNDES